MLGNSRSLKEPVPAISSLAAWPPEVGVRSSWIAVAVLTAADILAYVDRSVITLVIEPMKAELRLTDTQVALVMGVAFGLFFALAGLPLGWIADRLSRRRLITVTSAIWCVMTAATGLATGFWTLFASRMGVGVGEAALSPAAISLISDYFPKERRGPPIAIYTMAGAGGGGIALMLGGAVVGLFNRTKGLYAPLLGQVSPWQATFLAIGVGSAVILPFLLWLPEPARRDRGKDQSARDDREAIFAPGNSFALRHYASLAVFGIFVGAMTAWLPTLFIRQHGWSAAEAGLRFGVVLLVAASIGPLAGVWIEQRLAARGLAGASVVVTAGGMVLAGAVMGLSVLIGDANVALAGLGIGMFFVSVPSVTAIEAVHEAVPAGVRARATALVFISINVAGGLLGPLSVALLNDHLFGPAHLALSVSVVATTAGILSGLVALSGRRPFLALTHPAH
jgi:MFS family permease